MYPARTVGSRAWGLDMVRAGRIFLIAFVASLLPWMALAQDPPPPPPPPPPSPMTMPSRDAGLAKTGTGRLSGRVTSLETGRPIRRAVVQLGSPELREGRSVSTDAEGRWELRDLPAGRVSLTVSKGGFVSLQYGQRRPFEAGKPIELADKQVIDKIEIALPRAAAIAGRVVDEFGDPMVGARVTTMRHRFSNGQRRLTPIGNSDTTDDLGQFRVHGLAPGDYYVVANPTPTMMFAVSGDKTGYSQTYYPNALSTAEATRVTLAVGQEAQYIVIGVAPTRLVNVSGTVTNSEGQPIKAGVIRLLDMGTGPMTSSPGIIRPDGTFTISSVVPGEYRVMAQALRQSFEEIATTGSSSVSETAQTRIAVGSEDITGLALVTSSGATLRGQVRWEGGTAPTGTGNFNGSIVAFDPSDTGTPFGMAAGTVRDDGTFEIRNVQGTRVLRAGGFPKGWNLKAITLNGRDITDAPIDVVAGQDVTGIEVHATQTSAEISGTVQSAKGTAISDYVVVLFPPEAERWGWQSRFVRVVRPDQTGRFSIPGVPEASYLAVALEYMEPGEEGNPEFLEKLKALATRVSVAEGEKKTLTLKLSTQ